MGIKNFNVNGKNYLLDDVQANTIIEGFKASKMDTFDPEKPLYITDGKLGIDLSNYLTLDHLNSTRDSINTTISDNKNNADSKFSHIHTILKYILGDYVIINNEDMADILGDAPKLVTYNNDLEAVNGNINRIDNIIATNKDDIEKKLDEKSEALTRRIDEHAEENEQKFTDVENRCTTLEDELYGTIRTTSEGEETYKSRIDALEEKTDVVYDSLKTLGLIANVIDPPSLNRFDEINNAIDDLKSAIDEVKNEIEELKKQKETKTEE